MSRVRAGRIDLAHYRGRTYYERSVQAAEHAIREATGLVGVDDLGLAGVEDAIVRFHDRDGRQLEARAEEIAGPVVPASCGAAREPQTVVVATVL